MKIILNATAASFLFFGATCGALAQQAPDARSGFDFHKDVRPILEKACVQCHNADKPKGDYRLDTREHFLKSGSDGPRVISGKSVDSPLIHMVSRRDEDTAMPPNKSDALSAEQIQTLGHWIDSGMPWPEGFVLQARSNGAHKLEAEQLAKLPTASNKSIDFVKDIQPVFAENCLECHGPQRQEAGFRLDHKPTFLSGGELGPAIVPGNSAESLLIHMVSGLHASGTMPLKRPPLTKDQIGDLRAWIDQGADFPDSASVGMKSAKDHWAFQPPTRAAIPRDQNTIDYLVRSKLATSGLPPSEQASKTTLLRRLYLDLIGLPPTIQEQDAFLQDRSADAYNKQVEKLLSSPHYGERWARHWLDVARYADSDGFEKDKPRIAHFYRDWVVQALNRDLPFDQFIIEQIAGDLLESPTQDQIVATGFLRNSMINEEGGVDPEQFRMEAMFDRMDAIGKGILGLGLNCMQCHNHKYDPMTQEDYYRIFAFLNNDHESQVRVYSPTEWMTRANVLQQISEIEQSLQHQTADWEKRMNEWEDQWRATQKPQWTVVHAEIDKNSTGGQRFLPQPDGSFVTAGYQPTKATAGLLITTNVKNITGFRVETLHDENLPARGPGRSFMGTFGISEVKLEASDAAGKKEAVKIASATADLEAKPETPVHPNFNEQKPVKRYFGPASYVLDGNNDTGWSSDLGPGRRNFESTLVLALEKPINVEHETPFTLSIIQNIGGWNSDDLQAAQLGRFRVSVTSSDKPSADPVPSHVRAVLDVPRDRRTNSQKGIVFSYWRTTIPDWKENNSKIEALWNSHPEGTTQMTLTARDEPRLTSLLKRGDWLKPANEVKPGVPSILHSLPENAPLNRLTFARWLVDPRSPTTARVLVNRVWQNYFGTGIVSTSEDFGMAGDAPSHQELLDTLTVDFMEQGWSLKNLHRSIVQSETYKQSSRVTEQQLANDPQNRLLSRGPRFRVEGEIVRDIQLATSGLLNLKMGGRSVMPTAPAFLFVAPASYAPFPWIEETGEDRYRRALYTWRRRTTPYPFLQTFDTPEGNNTCIRRTRANTPLQALMGLNESVSVDAARALAQRILREGGPTDDARIEFAYRTVLCRPPTSAEKSEFANLLAKQAKRISDGWVNPWTVATGSQDSPKDLPDTVTPAQLAAYVVASRVLLNLDETITKE